MLKTCHDVRFEINQEGTKVCIGRCVDFMSI